MIAGPLLLVAALVLAVNVPFGYWRAGVPKRSFPWFVAVHAPVPIVILLRWASGLGFRLETLPVMLLAYFGGQVLGGRLRAAAKPTGR